MQTNTDNLNRALPARRRRGPQVAVAALALVAALGASTGAVLASTRSPGHHPAGTKAATGGKTGSSSSIRGGTTGRTRLDGAGKVATTKLAHQVDQGLGQLTAPPPWFVQTAVGCPVGTPTGSVMFVGLKPSDSNGCSFKLKSGLSEVWLYSTGAAASGSPALVVNGFKLYSVTEGGASGYLVPTLGIAVLWKGTYPKSVVYTLSWSPLHYLLTGGPQKPPANWNRVEFDGVSIAVPPSWPVKRPLRLACSGPFDHGSVVGLGVKVIPLPCPFMPPPTTPTDGALITRTDQLGSCAISGHLKIAGEEMKVCSDPSMQPPEAEVLIVMGSGSTAAHEYLTLGLGSDDTIAAEILGSFSELVPVGGSPAA